VAESLGFAEAQLGDTLDLANNFRVKEDVSIFWGDIV
jgi:hypothetical protein